MIQTQQLQSKRFSMKLRREIIFVRFCNKMLIHLCEKKKNVHDANLVRTTRSCKYCHFIFRTNKTANSDNFSDRQAYTDRQRPLLLGFSRRFYLHACDNGEGRNKVRNERSSEHVASLTKGGEGVASIVREFRFPREQSQETKNRAANAHVHTASIRMANERREREESQLRESTRVSFPEATPLILFRREKENVWIRDRNQRGLCPPLFFFHRLFTFPSFLSFFRFISFLRFFLFERNLGHSFEEPIPIDGT